MVKEEPRGAEFSGEEGLGRYLDLHEHHQRLVAAHKTFGRKVGAWRHDGKTRPSLTCRGQAGPWRESPSADLPSK